MTKHKDRWTTEISYSFSDADARKAAEARDIWPTVEVTLSHLKFDRELELVFDESILVLIEYVACAVLDAADGARSLAVPVNWRYRCEGKFQECGNGSLIYHSAGPGTVVLDVVALSSDVVPVDGRGRFDREARLDSKLPVDPVPVAVRDQLTALGDVGRAALAFYHDHGTDPTSIRGSLPDLIQDVNIALDNIEQRNPHPFDTSLDSYEELLLNNPTTAEEIHGPIRDEWLHSHALDSDVIERLIDERIRSAGPETARRWYKSLTWIGDEVTEQTLDALAIDPDQRAIGALLLFVWDDDLQFAPQAISVLGRLLTEHDAFEKTREDRWDVLQQVENSADRSEHAVVRAAAVEALGEIGEPSSQSVIESARDDPNPEVRAAAESALD